MFLFDCFFPWHIFKNYTISLTFQLGTQMEVLHHSTLWAPRPASHVMKNSTAWCLNTRHGWQPKCFSTSFDSSEGIFPTIIKANRSLFFTSGAWWTVCKQRGNCPSVRATRRWLVDGGKERDERTGASKLSGKNMIFTFLNLLLKFGLF